MGFIQTTKNLASQILKYAPHTDLWLGTNPKSSQRTVPLKKKHCELHHRSHSHDETSGFFFKFFFLPNDQLSGRAWCSGGTDWLQWPHSQSSQPAVAAPQTGLIDSVRCSSTARQHNSCCQKTLFFLAVFSLILLLISGEPKCWWHQKFHIISDLSEIMLTYSHSPNGKILH